MGNKIFTLLLAALAAQSLSAKQRTTRQLLNEAARAISTNTAGMKAMKANAGTLKVLQRDAQLSIVGYEGGRCVVVANDDTFQPVLAYYDASQDGSVNPAMQWWMDNMNESLASKLAGYEQPAKVERDPSYKETVEPLLTTTWGQSAPYSNLTPTYTRNGRTYNYVTGCVATAMAQVLKYNRFPEKGKSYNKWTFYPNGDDASGVDTRVTFNTTYDWDNMLDSYNGAYNDTQAEAVAKLMRDCGAASSMQYAPDGSGTTNTQALLGMRKNLRFDQATKNYMRDFTPTALWMDMVYSELNEGRPIMYGGATSDGAGHAFVFDGYDKDGLVHVEWGWDGDNDGYFDMSLLDSQSGSFSEGQQMILVRKPGETDYTYHSMLGTDEGFKITLSGTTINVGAIRIFNIDVDDFNGQLQLLCINPETGDGYQLSQIENINNLEFGMGGNITLGRIDLAGLDDGVWQIFFATQSTEEGKKEDGWHPVYGGDGVTDNYILIVKDGKYTLQKGNDDWSTPTGISHTTTANAATADSRVYTIDGRRISGSVNAAGKGLYIVGGKKIMVK